MALERSLWLSERALYKSKLAAAEATIASLRQELEGLRSNNHNGPPRNGRHSPTASASPPPAPLVEDGEVKVEGEEEAKEFHEIDEKTANRLYEQARRVVYPRAQRSWPEEKIDGDEGGGAGAGAGAGGGTNGHGHGHGHGDDDDGDGDDEEGDIKLILKKNTNFGWAF